MSLAAGESPKLRDSNRQKPPQRQILPDPEKRLHLRADFVD
jgi:hypothetical protein